MLVRERMDPGPDPQADHVEDGFDDESDLELTPTPSDHNPYSASNSDGGWDRNSGNESEESVSYQSRGQRVSRFEVPSDDSEHEGGAERPSLEETGLLHAKLNRPALIARGGVISYDQLGEPARGTLTRNAPALHCTARAPALRPTSSPIFYRKQFKEGKGEEGSGLWGGCHEGP